MKRTTKMVMGVAAGVLLSSAIGGFTAYKLMARQQMENAAFSELFQQNPNNIRLAGLGAANAQPVDLTKAAESSVHAVVHIRATELSKTRTIQTQPDFFDWFFGDAAASNARFRRSRVWASARASSSRRTDTS